MLLSLILFSLGFFLAEKKTWNGPTRTSKQNWHSPKQFMRASVRLKEVLFLKLNTFHAAMAFVNKVFLLHPKAVKLFIAWKIPICWSKTARPFCCRR